MDDADARARMIAHAEAFSRRFVSKIVCRSFCLARGEQIAVESTFTFADPLSKFTGDMSVAIRDETNGAQLGFLERMSGRHAHWMMGNDIPELDFLEGLGRYQVLVSSAPYYLMSILAPKPDAWWRGTMTSCRRVAGSMERGERFEIAFRETPRTVLALEYEAGQLLRMFKTVAGLSSHHDQVTYITD